MLGGVMPSTWEKGVERGMHGLMLEDDRRLPDGHEISPIGPYLGWFFGCLSS